MRSIYKQINTRKRIKKKHKREDKDVAREDKKIEKTSVGDEK